MRIYSMTATFGKLEHQTLTLDPGLNVIHAPNEWGKSTWCAFLVAMLYGIATKERTTQTAIADKERYAPWSGSPMSGRMDLSWNGRDITIERRTKGRAIFGDFKAYETATGLAVPELTAANCGEMLLGVEKSVFTRAGFLKLAHLPVTDDESLRRRLNALVTTGDESGDSDALEQKLKELKNRCRYNKSGLLPQAEAQRDDLTRKLGQLQELQTQTQQIRQQQEVLTEEIKQLENHRTALAYEASRRDADRVAQANAARDDAAKVLELQTAQCKDLPAKAQAQETLQKLEHLQTQWASLHAEVLPSSPQAPDVPPAFAGMDAAQAMQQAKSDKSAFDMLSKPVSAIPLILSAICLIAGVGLAFIQWYLLLPCVVLATILFLAHRRSKAAQLRDRHAVCVRYNGLSPEEWIPLAHTYQENERIFAEKMAEHNAQLRAFNNRKDALNHTTQQLTGGAALSDCLQNYRAIITRHDALEDAQRSFRQASDHASALSAMAKEVPQPAFADTLTDSPEKTATRLTNAAVERQQLHIKLGQYIGQMESLGQEDVLRQQLTAIQTRIDRLEDTYAALSIALHTLTEAANDLQRKFAPRISQRAQTLFGKLTGSRYDRLALGEDFSIQAGTQEEDTLRSSLWRSDGTVDQLYLAVRLAVAEELTPDAPLILDDALVRFDDTRLSLAMDILKEEAKTKQVILFTCQGRESALL